MRQPQVLSVPDALTLYDRGSYNQFFESMGRMVDLGRLFSTFETEATRWVSTVDPTSRWRRTLVAASVALEMAHRLRDEPPDRAGRYLVWASLLMRRHQPKATSPAERLWYLACIAGMQEHRNGWVLVAGLALGPSGVQSLARRLGPGGQLAFVAQRFPDEPRFQLARVALVESPLAGFKFVPSYVEFVRPHANDPVPDEPRSADELTALNVRNGARELLQQFTRLAQVNRAYRALGNIPSLRAEVELHLGYLESAAMNWRTALDHLARVPALTDEVYLQYLSYYFSGCAWKYMGDRAKAVVAFERATQLVPNARSAATHLAVELLLSDRVADRDQAYALLQATFANSAPVDPWRLYFLGDARLWPTYMAQLRQALQ